MLFQLLLVRSQREMIDVMRSNLKLNGKKAILGVPEWSSSDCSGEEGELDESVWHWR